MRCQRLWNLTHQCQHVTKKISPAKIFKTLNLYIKIFQLVKLGCMREFKSQKTQCQQFCDPCKYLHEIETTFEKAKHSNEESRWVRMTKNEGPKSHEVFMIFMQEIKNVLKYFGLVLFNKKFYFKTYFEFYVLFYLHMYCKTKSRSCNYFKSLLYLSKCP